MVPTKNYHFFHDVNPLWPNNARILTIWTLISSPNFITAFFNLEWITGASLEEVEILRPNLFYKKQGIRLQEIGASPDIIKRLGRLIEALRYSKSAKETYKNKRD